MEVSPTFKDRRAHLALRSVLMSRWSRPRSILARAAASPGCLVSGSGTITLSSSTLIDVAPGTTAEIDSNITGSSSVLVKQDSGQLTFGGSGTVEVGALKDVGYGTLEIDNNVFITNGNNSGVGLEVDDYATLQGTGTVSLVAASPLSYQSGQTSTFSGAITGAGSVQLGTSTSTGIGTLVLAGTNRYTGGTFLDDGTLNTNSANAIGGSTATLTFAGNATLQAGGPLSLGNDIIVNSGSIPTFDTNGQTMTLSGPIVGGPTTAIPSLSVIDSLNNGLLDIAASETLCEVTVSRGTLDVGPGGTLNLVAGGGLDDGLHARPEHLRQLRRLVRHQHDHSRRGHDQPRHGHGAFAAKATRPANLTGGLPAGPA